ncbi:MAG: redoxin domain-containing protein [Candidatus Paceibacterota bacterium]
MNNQNNKPLVFSIVILSIVILFLGYFLIKNPSQGPKTNPQTSVNNSNTTPNPHDHGGASIATDNTLLNSLVGKTMPAISLSDKDGKIYTPADLKGKNIVLFFNEGLMCYPACWNQMSAFGSDARFNNDKTQAISVVVDPAKDWQKAIDQMPELAKTMTMFDINANTSKQLGLLTTASSMHRGSLPGHTYIVIDKEGIVRYVFDDPNMAIANDMLIQKIEKL